MKRIIFILTPIVALACFCMLPGCKKINEYPSHTAVISFPTIKLVGPADTTINRGAAWHDPGATWKDTVTGESGTLTSTTINTGVDSAYLLVYTATNKNGFQSFVARGLGVTNYNGTLNLTGAYNQSSVNVYQSARALFSIDNADGFGGGDSSVIVIKSDSTISVATIGTYITGTNGVALPETFTGTQVLFEPAFVYTGNPPRLTAQPAVIFGYTVTIPECASGSGQFLSKLTIIIYFLK